MMCLAKRRGPSSMRSWLIILIMMMTIIITCLIVVGNMLFPAPTMFANPIVQCTTGNQPLTITMTMTSNATTNADYDGPGVTAEEEPLMQNMFLI